MRFRDIKKQKNKKQKEKTLTDVKYATFTDRIKALITDLFMIYIPILYIITYLVLDGKDEFQSSQLAPLVAVSLYGLVYALLVSKFGQTPGKKAYLIKIVDSKTQENISFIRAFYRFTAFLLSATSLLGLLLPLFRADKKALHDIMANTAVIAINE